MEYEKMIIEKKEIRKKMRKLRRELCNDIDKKKKYDNLLLENLLKSKEYKEADNIFCYVGMNNEINTSVFIEKALIAGKTVSVPKVTGDITMEAVTIKSLQELIKTEPHGILEPKTLYPIMNKIDLIIVPGLAFDLKGGRIGYGGGYYDVFIKSHREAKTVALCYNFQVVDHIPMEEHDVVIDKIICK